MIPPFNEFGYLPPGVHLATLSEIESRFGRDSEIRRMELQSVPWMLDLAIRAGAQRVVLNGSFVTSIMEPNDVDCVLLFIPGRRRNRKAFRELQTGLPFLDIAIVNQQDFDVLVSSFFAGDRQGTPKGMVEVIGWT